MPSAKPQTVATKRPPKSTPTADLGKSPSVLIDQRIAELADWRGELLAKLRTLINGAAADITEEWKWNTPVWSCNGIICTGESYKKAIKLTFMQGAYVNDPLKLFNSSLDGNTRRAIDFHEGTKIDEKAFKALIKAAIAVNRI